MLPWLACVGGVTGERVGRVVVVASVGRATDGVAMSLVCDGGGVGDASCVDERAPQHPTSKLSNPNSQSQWNALPNISSSSEDYYQCRGIDAIVGLNAWPDRRR